MTGSLSEHMSTCQPVDAVNAVAHWDMCKNSAVQKSETTSYVQYVNTASGNMTLELLERELLFGGVCNMTNSTSSN